MKVFMTVRPMKDTFNLVSQEVPGFNKTSVFVYSDCIVCQ